MTTKLISRRFALTKPVGLIVRLRYEDDSSQPELARFAFLAFGGSS